MKKGMSMLLVVAIMLGCMFVGTPTLNAAKKADDARAIAIVFDNSGSMYDDGDQAWCRATYAMEVFASMLNKGDVLQIYPMHPIMIEGKKYTMDEPFQMSDAAQASSIRDIFTEEALGTPIESIDCAIKGLKANSIKKKYLVVLTDGGIFSKGGPALTEEQTLQELDSRIQANANKDMTVMYLGIGSEACVPSTSESEYFVKKQAVNTADVLSTLTDMCNLIFGRDSLPKNHISGKKIDFDISMKKLIVFVQGENISKLKLEPERGDLSKYLVSSRDTKYSTKGAGDYESHPDKSLQGMIVTYEDLEAGEYKIDYSGTATSVEVYYEPDADLDFVFTDADGNDVDLKGLYQGDYKVSFGLKDAKTGKLISSDLLGKPHYEGSYTINGKKTKFDHDGKSGEVPISLKMGDTFKADLTVTYLSGYTISKDSSDFGWPEEGVRVIAPPLKKFRAELKVPQSYILVKELDQSKAITVNLSIGGKKLTADEFDAVKLEVDCGGIEHTVTPLKDQSQYEIKLKSTKGIQPDSYQIKVQAKYADKAERTAQANDTAKITLSNIPLWVKWTVGILLLLILALIIWAILHIKVLPRYANTSRKVSYFVYDGNTVTDSTNFKAELTKSGLQVQARYGGKRFGVSTGNVRPGPDSYLYKQQKRRTAQMLESSVRNGGNGKLNEVWLGSVRYIPDEKGKFVPAVPSKKLPILRNAMQVRYSGTIQEAGVNKDFEGRSTLNFKKK